MLIDKLLTTRAWTRRGRLGTLTVLCAAALAGQLLTATPAAAGRLEDALRSRWQGAWVVIRADVRSACGEAYSNNRVSGRLVSGKGEQRLALGELGQIHKIDVKRQRIDVLIDLVEPLRVAYVEGPFELYRQAACKIELQLDVSRQVVKAAQEEQVGEFLLAVLERYDSRAEAEESELWNLRRVEPFPEGYDRLLADYDAWRAEQIFVAVREKLARVLDEAVRIADRARSDDAYGAGFTTGLRSTSAHYHTAADCGLLVDKVYYPGSVPSPPSYDSNSARDAWRDGYGDGQALSFHLDLARQLERCLP